MISMGMMRMRWVGRGERVSGGGLDLLPAAVGAVALVVYVLHGFDGVLTRDLALYSYSAQRVADGAPPYVGVVNRAGPLAHLLPALGVAAARVGGLDEVLAMRLLFLLLAIAAVCVAYLLGRDLFASRPAGLAAATLLLSLHGFSEYASYGPREKTAMVLLLLCCMLAVVRQRWFTAGLFLALATLCWQPAFVVGLVATSVAMLALPPRDWLPSIGRVVAGGLVPSAACLAYFAAVGALPAFLDGFVFLNLRYTDADPFIPAFAENVTHLQNAYRASFWFFLAGLAALILLASSAWWRRMWPDRTRAMSVVAFGAACVTAGAWSLRDFDAWPDVFVFMPFAAVGFGGLVYALRAWLPPRPLLALTLAWVVAGTAVAVDFAVRAHDDRLQVQRAVVRAVMARLPDDVSMLSIEAPQPLVLSGRTNPTRHQMFAAGLHRYVDDTWPGGLEGYGDWVGRTEPTLLSVAGPRRPWLVETLNADYWRVGRAPAWVWYVHRSVGPEALSDLRDAADRSQSS